MPVAIEKKVVDGTVDVVVMRHVALRTARGIELHEPPDQIPGDHQTLVQRGSGWCWMLESNRARRS